jgi:phenylacetate-CoA ligase
MSAESWDRRGRRKALQVFQRAATTVPAYQDLLRQRDVRPDQVKDFAAFQELVPIIDRDSFLRGRPLADLMDRPLARCYTFSMSSGSSGPPCLWPRAWGHHSAVPTYFETFLRDTCEIHTRSSLFVVALALGVWIAGEYNVEYLKEIAKRGYNLTVATPGADAAQVARVIKRLADYYDQTIIIVYPSFLPAILREGDELGIDWRTLKIRLFLGGECSPEPWRQQIRETLGVDETDITTFFDVYASADVDGAAGFGTPVTSLVRLLCSRDGALCNDLFGVTEVPTIVQLNPLATWVEVVNDEIVLTRDGMIPLVRYNTHDIGGLIPFPHMVSLLRHHGHDVEQALTEHGYDPRRVWRWPFLFTTGRNQSISVNGANVYPENIRAALARGEMQGIQAFRLSTDLDEKSRLRFTISVELTPGAQVGEGAADLYRRAFLETLLAVNSDFAAAYRENPEAADPRVVLYPAGTGPFAPILGSGKGSSAVRVQDV